MLNAKQTYGIFLFKCVPDLSDRKSVEPMKFREPVPILLKKKKKKKLATAVSSLAAAARTHTDIDMSHSTPEQPTFGEHDESDALRSDTIAAAELDDLRDRRVYAARLGCILHNLHVAVTARSSRAHSARAHGTSGKEITRIRAFSPKLLFQPFSAALWLHRAVDVLPRATYPPQRALPSL